MRLICGQVNRIWHMLVGRYPDSVGVLISPSYGRRVPIDPWMPFVLDNDAYGCWVKNKPWDESAWLDMIKWVESTKQIPLWAAVPDVVANREATIANWPKYSPIIKNLGWKAAFCVQDGMGISDVPNDADIIFVGGSDRWKFPNLPKWKHSGKPVHCARVNSRDSIEMCEREGCVSVDGTGWFRDPSRKDKLPMIKKFIEGYRSPVPPKQMELFNNL